MFDRVVPANSVAPDSVITIISTCTNSVSTYMGVAKWHPYTHVRIYIADSIVYIRTGIRIRYRIDTCNYAYACIQLNCKHCKQHRTSDSAASERGSECGSEFMNFEINLRHGQLQLCERCEVWPILKRIRSDMF